MATTAGGPIAQFKDLCLDAVDPVRAGGFWSHVLDYRPEPTAETVDRLIGFAETTHAVSPTLIDAVYEAYLGDERVRDFIQCENPKALVAMAERFLSARRRGLWHSRRNAVDAELEMLLLPGDERVRA